MHPILLQFGQFSIKTYGFFIAVGFMAGIGLALREARRLEYNPQFILDLAFYMIVGAIVGSRVFYVATHLSSYRAHPLDALKLWQGGLTFFGGFILAVIICIVLIKRQGLSVWKTFDLFAPSLAVGVFFGRIGCFFAGCCYGKPCSLPWAITFNNPESLAQLNIPLHPTQLYSAGGALVTFLILFMLRKRKSFDGQLALLWILLYSSFRTGIELFRGDMRGDLLLGRYPSSQAMALLLIVVSLVALFILRGRARSRKV